MDRKDLRVWTCQEMYESPQHEVDCTRPVTDADLASLGLVQAPVCENPECERGFVHDGYDGLHNKSAPCPSCAGSGFAKLVALDGIDVEALRMAYRYGVHTPTLPERDQAWAVIFEQIEAVLAAIDQEETQ